jgi:hypothetical protein
MADETKECCPPNCGQAECPIEYFVPRKPLCAPTGEISFDAQEIQYFDSVAAEYGSHGVTIEFYKQDVAAATYDPLYGEPIQRVWHGPFKLEGFVEAVSADPSVDEHGNATLFETSVYVARQEFDKAHSRYPDEGDIIRVWNLPYLNSTDFALGDTADAGVYLDVVDTSPSGHIFANGEFVGFKIGARRASEDPPERRLFVR